MQESPKDTEVSQNEPALDEVGSGQRTGSVRRFPRLSILTATACWLYAVGVITVFLLMRLAGERWWPATLLLFWPRWVWVAPLAVLFPLTLLFRRRMAIPALLAAIIVLCGVMDFRFPWRAVLDRGPAHESLRVFTCNLHNTQSDPAVLNAFIAETRPDIILLQEYSRHREPAVVREGRWYAGVYEGIYIASRYPVRELEDLLPADAESAEYASHGWNVGRAVCYAVDLPGGTIHLVNLHLASPHPALGKLRHDVAGGAGPLEANSARRALESAKISAEVRRIGGPFLLAGDFNTPDDSPIFQHAWPELDDAFSSAGLGFGTTYERNHTWLRIDHIVYSPDWQCRECRVGPPVGSGHRPVFARFER